LAEGDYHLPTEKQDHKNIPPPRIGARMVCVDSNKIFVHNGHDNENEKLLDLWCFDLTTNKWNEI
jgi:hypothetical protein